MLNEDELAAIEERCRAVPAGPWRVELIEHDTFLVETHVETAATLNPKFYPKEVAQRPAEFEVTDKDGNVIHNPKMQCDLTPAALAKPKFIAHAREDVPKLLADIRELRERLGLSGKP